MAMFQSTFVLSVLGYERFHAIDRQSDNRYAAYGLPGFQGPLKYALKNLYNSGDQNIYLKTAW